MKYLKYVFLFLLIIIDGFIIYQSCLSSTESSDTSSEVTKIIVRIIDVILPGDRSIEDIYGVDQVHSFIRKSIGHFGLFFVTSVLACATFYLLINKKLYFNLIHYFHGLLLAITSEFIQLFVKGRDGSIKDVIIDYSGYICGTVIILLMIYMILKRKEKRDVRQ